MLCALEIFSNPYDLCIAFGRKNEGDKYAFAICRGPGHNYKPMLSTQPFFEKAEDVIDYIKQLLELAHKTASDAAKDPASLFSQFFNPDGDPIDESKILTPDLIKRVLDELEKNQKVDTTEMKPITK